jgi:uncharacterized protein (UPF0262 family)
VSSERRCLVDIKFDDNSVRLAAEIEHERAVAVYDLLAENEFALIGDDGGPYWLRIGVRENRLILKIGQENQPETEEVVLPLSPFRGLIRDYFRVCDAYYEAIKTATRSRIEAIDMGRRGLHDEGAEALRARLSSRIEMDAQTGRRLFTLICVMHLGAWRE